MIEKAKQDEKNGFGTATRGTGPYLPSKKMANLILCWGCPPSRMVLADTVMIHEFFATLQDRYDRKTLSVTFPDKLNEMLETKKEDALWEIWKSN